MMTLPENELRSLVSLLDEEDPANLELVQRRILDAGLAALTHLEELRRRSDPELSGRIDALCRQLRYRGLCESCRELAACPEPDLERGVWLIAKFGYPGADTAVYAGWLDSLAADIRRSVPPGGEAAAGFAHLNSQLFTVMGFKGDEKHYYDPDNSYLNRVIENRRGIPVSLSALYLLICKRLGLPAHGVATPGHFLVGLREKDGQTCYLDAYNRGRIMTQAEVKRMLSRNGYEFRPEFTAPASSRDILVRMVRNLISIYQKEARPDQAEMLSGLAQILLTGKAQRPTAAPQ